MRTAIIVFTKVPQVGITKTRLTIARGGILTPEEANSLYEACLLDVINVCTAAERGDVWICCNVDGDRQYLEKMLERAAEPSKIKGIFADQGGHFDVCMQFAGDYLLQKGGAGRMADGIIVVGGDLPSMQPVIIRDAVQKLERLAASNEGMAAASAVEGPVIGAGIVGGACQEGGFSLIGYTCATPFDYTGVFYNMDGITALDMLVDKAREGNIPFALVEMAPDVDIPVDLASMIPVIKALELASRYDGNVMKPVNTLAVIKEMGFVASAAPPQK